MAISIIVVYFVLIFGVVALQRRVSSYDDFLVGRKNTGTWVTALSVRAAGESGWLVLGLTGLGYVIGIHGIWVVVGETLFESLSWLWLARRFKRDTEKHNVTSVVDYIEVKSGDSVGIVRFVASMIIILMFVTYLAAQVSAFGKAFYSFLGIRPILGMIVGMALVFLYCSIGGYRAVAKISSIHGLVMIFGIMAMPILCFLVLNDRGLSLTKISAPAPYFWNIWGEHGFSTAGIISALSYFAIGLAFLGAPHLYTKFLASKSPYVIARGTPIAIAFTAIGDSCALLTGVLGRYIFPHLADGEYVVPLLSKSIFAPVMIGVFAVVAMAAIMSTADALLHQVATAIFTRFNGYCRHFCHYCGIWRFEAGILDGLIFLGRSRLCFQPSHDCFWFENKGYQVRRVVRSHRRLLCGCILEYVLC
jgi:sodium/proline symporter